MKDYYKILGLDFEAEPEVIQYAYKALCRKYHPDVYKGPDAEGKMKEINEAYSTLIDPIKRRNYDNLIRKRREPFSGADRNEAPPKEKSHNQAKQDGPKSPLSHEITTLDEFRRIKREDNGYMVIIDKPTKNRRIHVPSCSFVKEEYFQTKVIVYGRRNGNYFWTNDLKFAESKWDATVCNACI